MTNATRASSTSEPCNCLASMMRRLHHPRDATASLSKRTGVVKPVASGGGALRPPRDAGTHRMMALAWGFIDHLDSTDSFQLLDCSETGGADPVQRIPCKK